MEVLDLNTLLQWTHTVGFFGAGVGAGVVSGGAGGGGGGGGG